MHSSSVHLETQNLDTHNAALLLIRGILGAVFVFHGSQKLLGWFGGYGLQATAQWLESLGIPFALASAALDGSVELFGGLLLLAGIAVRWVTVPMAVAMLVAATTAHQGFDVTQGGGEYPITLAVVLVALGLLGPGRWTLPALISQARGSRGQGATPSRTAGIATLIFIMLPVLGLDPAAANTQPQGDTMTDQQQIRRSLDRYEAALNTSDVDAVLELYAADGVFMPTNAPTAAGTAAVRAAYEHVFDTIRLDIAFSVHEIVVDDDLAFATTDSRGRVTVLAEEITVPEENRELFVFQKIDGVWKIARYMFNKTSLR